MIHRLRNFSGPPFIAGIKSCGAHNRHFSISLTIQVRRQFFYPQTADQKNDTPETQSSYECASQPNQAVGENPTFGTEPINSLRFLKVERFWSSQKAKINDF